MSEDLQRLCTLKIENVDEKFAVSSLDWLAGIGRSDCFALQVVPRKRRDRLTLAGELFGKRAQITWKTESTTRRLHAVVLEVTTAPGGLHLLLASREAVLAEQVDYRVFVEESVVDAAKAVLSASVFDVEDGGCTAAHPKHPQIVQHFETDLDFVTRILSREGVTWLPNPDHAFSVKFVDTKDGFEALQSPDFSLLDDSGQSTEEKVPTLFDVQVAWHETTDMVSLRDHDFMNFTTTLGAEAVEGKKKLEHYDYRGPFTDTTVGNRLAQQRLEALRRDRSVLLANSFYRDLRPGRVIVLKHAPTKGAPTKWLVTLVRTRVFARSQSNKRGYEISISAIPATTEYRPKIRPPHDTQGVETVTVTVPKGLEIEPDATGRITALFRWDRRRPRDQTSSTPWRVVQPATSGGVLLPRKNWEELTGFWFGTADDPLLIGRLYETKAAPPSSLPASKTQTAFGTLTTPNGGSANLVAFDDAAGKESMTFNASYDFNERTENDKVTDITVDETSTVGVNNDIIVGQVHQVTVKGSQSWTIGATHDLSVKSNYHIETGTESITVGGARLFDIAGDQATQTGMLTRMVAGAKTAVAIEQESILVKGASTRTYAGTWIQVAQQGVGVTVGGACGLQVAGMRTVKCKGYTVSGKSLTETDASRSEKAGGDWAWTGKGGIKFDIAGACSMKGSDVVFEADNKIEIKAGGVKVTITSSKVTIKGKYKSAQKSADSATESYD